MASSVGNVAKKKRISPNIFRLDNPFEDRKEIIIKDENILNSKDFSHQHADILVKQKAIKAKIIQREKHEDVIIQKLKQKKMVLVKELESVSKELSLLSEEKVENRKIVARVKQINQEIKQIYYSANLNSQNEAEKKKSLNTTMIKSIKELENIEKNINVPNFTREIRKDIVILKSSLINGSLYDVQELSAAIKNILLLGKTKIILDHSTLLYMDTTYLGVLVSFARKLNKKDGLFCLVCRDNIQLPPFAIMNINKYIIQHNNLNDAVADLG